MINKNSWRKSLAIVLFSGLTATSAAAQEKKEIIIRDAGAGNKETVIILEKNGEGAAAGARLTEKFDLLVPAPGSIDHAFVTGAPPMQGPGASFSFTAIGNEALPFENNVVKGAPYSADALNEFTQTLPDGNRIQRRSESQIHRDSEGRTRREFSPLMVGMMPGLPDLGKTIQIVDPVAGTTMILNPQSRTASKLPSIATTVSISKVIEKGMEKSGENIELKILSDVASADAQSGTTRIITRRVEGMPLPPKGAVVTEGANPAITRQFAFIARDEKNLRTESLGRQTIEGVEAEGTRTVTTIPAGEVGNEKPIEIVNERWYSKDLQMVLMTRHSDPRFGDNVYRVTNINRAEPDAALFVVPADYKLTEGQMLMKKVGKPE